MSQNLFCKNSIVNSVIHNVVSFIGRGAHANDNVLPGVPSVGIHAGDLVVHFHRRLHSHGCDSGVPRNGA